MRAPQQSLTAHCMTQIVKLVLHVPPLQVHRALRMAHLQAPQGVGWVVVTSAHREAQAQALAQHVMRIKLKLFLEGPAATR